MVTAGLLVVAVAAAAATAVRGWKITMTPHVLAGDGENFWRSADGDMVENFGADVVECHILAPDVSLPQWFEDEANTAQEKFWVIVVTDPAHRDSGAIPEWHGCTNCNGGCCQDYYFDLAGDRPEITGFTTFRNIVFNGDLTDNWCVPKGFKKRCDKADPNQDQCNECAEEYNGRCQTLDETGANPSGLPGDCHFGHTAFVVNREPKACVVTTSNVKPIIQNQGIFAPVEFPTHHVTVVGDDANAPPGPETGTVPLKAIMWNKPADCAGWLAEKVARETTYRVQACGNGAHHHSLMATRKDFGVDMGVGLLCGGHGAGGTCLPTNDVCKVKGCVGANDVCESADLLFSTDFSHTVAVTDNPSFQCGTQFDEDQHVYVKIYADSDTLTTPSGAGAESPIVPIDMCCSAVNSVGSPTPMPVAVSPGGPVSNTPPGPSLSVTSTAATTTASVALAAVLVVLSALALSLIA